MSRTDVSKFYNEIIDNVISNVKEEFENEGVDEQILDELKQIWKTKLVQSRALESHGPQYPTGASTAALNQAANRNYLKPDIGTAGKRVELPHAQPVLSGPAEMASIAIQNVPHINLPTELAQQSIALPQAAAGTQQPVYRCYQVGDQLVYAVQQPTMQQVQAAVLQQQQQQQLQQQQQQRQLSGPATQATSALQQIQVQSQSQPTSVLQVDGGNDSSSDDDDFGDDDEDDDDGAKEDDDGDEDGEENQGVQEEPLNSDDDESGDELEEDIFDTDNVIVCQYEKINRTRNRWKFHLKDGIMNLDGKDWVFHRGIGEADW